MEKGTIQSAFERQVASGKDRTAIEYGQRRLTYGEVNDRADRLAWILKSLGAGREEIVKVYMTSSPELVISALGIFKSGGVFLPLGVSFPKKRLTYIFNQFPPGIIITSGDMRSEMISLIQDLKLPLSHLVVLEGDRFSVLSFEEGALGEMQQAEITIPQGGCPDTSEPDDGCYILFTSGTTGEGKAILGRHKSLYHFINWERNEFHVGDECRVSQLNQMTFDSWFRDVFVPLCTGGVLCIPPDEIRDNMMQLLEWIDSSRITLMHFVPTVFRLLTREFERHDRRNELFTDLKFILLAGELLYAKDLLHWQRINNSRVEFVNMYGATEATMCKCFYRVGEIPENPAYVIPIGKPMSNTSIAIFNNNTPCDTGEIGEIYIRTPYLTRGYLNDPEMNARAFVQNPLVKDREDIVYRTGDLGRFLGDHTIEILGRVDNQVKINGIRIELGEIEHAVLTNKGVVQTVIVVHKKADHPDELICYYTGHVLSEQLRDHLLGELNRNIIPSYFIRLDEFPTTINGKVDKKALPKPEMLIEEEEYQAPENEMEIRLEAIWRHMLGLDRISRTTSFFRAGGTSTKAIQVISRIYKELDISIKVTDIFANNTIEKLAGLLLNASKTKYSAIKPIEEQEHYSMSNAQKRIWIIHQLPGRQDVHTLSRSWLLKGRLQTEALEKAVRSMVLRHESLRTVFVTIGGEVRQKIKDPEEQAFSLTLNDLRNEPFDLVNGPLVRFGLRRLDENEHVFTFAIHHIICDGWSMNIMINELMHAYNSIGHGDAGLLQPLPFQYKDYVSWQHKQLSTASYQASERYWLDRFSGEVPILHLPEDLPRPPMKTYDGAYFDFVIDSTLYDRIKQFCREKDLSLFTLLLASIKCLLYRYTGQHDIVVGTPVFGHGRKELEDQTGLYINTVALRTTFSPDESFHQLLDKVQQTMAEAIEHSRYPFDQLVMALDAKRDWSRSPLFDVWAVLQNPQSKGDVKLLMDGLEVYDFNRDVRISLHDLSFNFYESDNLFSTIVYNPKLFHHSTITRLADHWRLLLDAVVGGSDQAIRSIPYLDVADYRELDSLNGSGITHREYSDNLVSRFERNVREYPDAPAVYYEGECLNYFELNEKANVLASTIRRECGDNEHPIVALLLDRSTDMPVAMLAALKAGGAYLPVNPGDPKERIDYILQDANPAILLTHIRHLHKLENAPGNILVLDIQTGDIPAEAANPPGDAGDDDIACIIYTSGSTGLPKGSLITRRAMLNLIDGLQRSYLQVEEKLKIAVVAPYVFDPFGKQVFLALLNGHSLFIVPDHVKLSGNLLWDYYLRNGIMQTDGTPALLQILTGDLPEKAVCNPLSRFWIGGAALPANSVARLFDFYRKNSWPVSLLNEYGLTECCVDNTCYPVDPDHLSLYDYLPTGKPLLNNQIYILDEHLGTVPRGVSGEICIAGAGLGLGYLNRPELTNARFVKYRRWDGEVILLYRTGDIGRWLPDGNLAYTGRSDDQVKIRGYRIELAEVEGRFRKIKGVKDVCVIAWREENETILAGYYSSKEELGVSDIRSELNRFLPAYMIPDHIIRLPEFPLTVNGKIDKKKLPSPFVTSEGTKEGYVAAGTPMEKKLAGIWQEVLGKDRIGVTENFFEIGGHSLKAVQIISRIFPELNVKMEVATLFGNPTIRQLAKVVESASPARHQAIAAMEEQEYYEASHAQKRFWILNDEYTFNIFGAYMLTGPLDAKALVEAVTQFVRRHEILRTTLFYFEGNLKQKVNSYEQSGFTVEISDLIHEANPEDEALRRADREKTRSFDLVTGPLVRAELARLHPSGYVFFFSMHHSVADAFSLDVASAEIFSYYNNAVGNGNKLPPPLQVQYKDYSAWHNSLLGTGQGRVHKEYWLKKFGDGLTTFDLPLDLTRPPVRSYRSKRRTFVIPSELLSSLKTIAFEENTSLFTVLLGIVDVLLYRYTGCRNITVGTTISNRTDRSLEDQIGCYIDVLPLQTILEPDDIFPVVLGKVKTTLLEAYEHQAYPFDLLVEALNLDRSANRHLVFDVLVQLVRDEPDENVQQMKNIRVNTFSSGQPEGILDLMFLFTETPSSCSLTLLYDTELFREETIMRMMEDWMRVGDAVVRDRTGSMNDIPLSATRHEQSALENFAKEIV
ncbi:MAG: amino acid adenylation domain-containing protein [Chitinophagaceae bacterium]|nr:amino acid adenylation domain-containing protein [Chitinophagaceae bacterium]